MDRRTVAMILSFIGVLCFLAMAFNVVSANYALFAGVAFFIASGLVWAVMRRPQ